MYFIPKHMGCTFSGMVIDIFTCVTYVLFVWFFYACNNNRNCELIEVRCRNVDPYWSCLDVTCLLGIYYYRCLSSEDRSELPQIYIDTISTKPTSFSVFVCVCGFTIAVSILTHHHQTFNEYGNLESNLFHRFVYD